MRNKFMRNWKKQRSTSIRVAVHENTKSKTLRPTNTSSMRIFGKKTRTYSSRMQIWFKNQKSSL